LTAQFLILPHFSVNQPINSRQNIIIILAFAVKLKKADGRLTESLTVF